MNIGLRNYNFGSEIVQNCPPKKVDFLVFANHPAVDIGGVSRRLSKSRESIVVMSGSSVVYCVHPVSSDWFAQSTSLLTLHHLDLL